MAVDRKEVFESEAGVEQSWVQSQGVSVGMQSVGRGYTVVQTAQLVAAMRWLTERLFEITGAWAVEVAAASSDGDSIDSAAGFGDVGADAPTDVAAVAVWLAAVSRCLGSHREALDELQPDSVLLDIYRVPAPPSAVVCAALDEVSAASLGWLERTEMVLNVFLSELMEVCDEIERVAAPHCDGALIRVVRKLRLDLSIDHASGSKLRLPDRSDSGPRTHSADSDGMIARVIGVISENRLVSRAVLCPETSDALP